MNSSKPVTATRRDIIKQVYREHLARHIAAALPTEVALKMPDEHVDAIALAIIQEWLRGNLRGSFLHRCPECGCLFLKGLVASECPECGLEMPEGQQVVLDGINHMILRRFIIRPKMLEAGLSLLPLKWTSLRYPKPFDLYMKWYRVRTRRPADHRTTDEKIEDMREENRQERQEEFRKSRQKQLTFRMHRWGPGDDSGKKMTLWELARDHGGVADPASKTYKRIKELWTTQNITGREAVERGKEDH